MVLTLGQLYTIRVGSGNTHTAIDWGQKIPASANKVLNKCVLEIMEDIRGEKEAEGDKWDYKVNIYDITDDSIIHENIRINSSHSVFTESGWKTPQMRAKMKKRKKIKHRKRKHSSKKRRRSKKRRKSKRRRNRRSKNKFHK